MTIGKMTDEEIIDVLVQEIHVLDDLVADEQDEEVVQELKDERALLVVKLNSICGVDHIAAGGKISVINNDLNKH